MQQMISHQRQHHVQLEVTGSGNRRIIADKAGADHGNGFRYALEVTGMVLNKQQIGDRFKFKLQADSEIFSNWSRTWLIRLPLISRS